MLLQVAFHHLSGGGTGFAKQNGNASEPVGRPNVGAYRRLYSDQYELVFHQDVLFEPHFGLDRNEREVDLIGGKLL